MLPTSTGTVTSRIIPRLVFSPIVAWANLHVKASVLAVPRHTDAATRHETRWDVIEVDCCHALGSVLRFGLTPRERGRKVPEVITIGELLIDFVSTESGPLEDVPGFVKAAGGAPANVAVALVRLGVSAGFIGQVGEDGFGRFLKSTLRRNGVDVSHLRTTDEARTALAFVSLKDDGDRDFLFYSDRSADQLLRPEDIDETYIRSAGIFHYGTITLIASPAREATMRAIQIAREHGVWVSCDPNVRLPLWPDPDEARQKILEALRWADLLKLSEEEAAFLTGAQGLEESVRRLEEWCSGAITVITRGPKGCYYRWGDHSGYVPGYSVEAVDGTGAGDGFTAALLARAVETRASGLSLSRLTHDEVLGGLRHANAVGALTTTRRGAIPSLPSSQEVLRFLASAEIRRA